MATNLETKFCYGKSKELGGDGGVGETSNETTMMEELREGSSKKGNKIQTIEKSWEEIEVEIKGVSDSHMHEVNNISGSMGQNSYREGQHLAGLKSIGPNKNGPTHLLASGSGHQLNTLRLQDL